MPMYKKRPHKELAVKVLLSFCIAALSVTAVSIDIKDMTLTEQDVKDAARFGLTLEQWERYKNHMEGDGKYMEPVHPIESLAIISENEKERRDLAMLYAEKELFYTKNTLAFDQYFSEAVETIVRSSPQYSDKKLNLDKLSEHYTGLDREDTFYGTYKDGDQIRLSLDLDNEKQAKLAFRKAHAIYRTHQEQGINIKLHLFFNGDEDAIRQWAKKTVITPLDTMTGKLTLTTLNDVDTEYFVPQVWRNGEYLWSID